MVARQIEHSRDSFAERCLQLRPGGAVDVSECTQLESDERHGLIERKAVRGMYQDLLARDRILRGSEDRVEIALRRRREACYCYPSGSTHRHVGVLVVGQFRDPAPSSLLKIRDADELGRCLRHRLHHFRLHDRTAETGPASAGIDDSSNTEIVIDHLALFLSLALLTGSAR